VTANVQGTPTLRCTWPRGEPWQKRDVSVPLLSAAEESHRDAIIYPVGLIAIVMSATAIVIEGGLDGTLAQPRLPGRHPSWAPSSAGALCAAALSFVLLTFELPSRFAAVVKFLSERFSLAHSLVARRRVPSISKGEVSSGETP
jgi:hypothetical protein